MNTYIIKYESESCDRYTFKCKGFSKPSYGDVEKMLLAASPEEALDENSMGGEWDIVSFDNLEDITLNGGGDK